MWTVLWYTRSRSQVNAALVSECETVLWSLFYTRVHFVPIWIIRPWHNREHVLFSFHILTRLKQKQRKERIFTIHLGCAGSWSHHSGSLLWCADSHQPSFFAGMWDPGFPTRDRTYFPCTARQTLNHWATREVPKMIFSEYLLWKSAFWNMTSYLIFTTNLETLHFRDVEQLFPDKFPKFKLRSASGQCHSAS